MTNDNQSDDLSVEVPLYLLATRDDFATFDFEEPIAECRDAECYFIEKTYKAQMKAIEGEGVSPRLRVYSSLAAICSFYFRAADIAEPFGPMIVMDGMRTPIPEDFKGQPIDALTSIAMDIRNLPLRARICDMIWLLDRSKFQLGKIAVNTYREIIEKIQVGELSFADTEHGPHCSRSIGLLRRALFISRGMKNPDDIFIPLKEKIVELRLAVKEKELPSATYQFSKLDLDFRLSCPSEVVVALENVIDKEQYLPDQSKYWDLAAFGYQEAKSDENKWRCRVEAAECLISFADTQNSAMFKSHWISDGLAAYHGIPDKRERRKELRHKLIDVQGDINEEMSSFSHTTDISDLVDATEKSVRDASFFIRLGILASVSKPGDPKVLRQEAIESIEKNPLSSLFGSSFHDSKGKVVHRSLGAGVDDVNETSIEGQIVQHEGLIRNLVVGSAIAPILRILQAENSIGELEIAFICEHSSFVPVDRRRTFIEGFLHFFRGNQIPALNTLTPQLENSIRHILQLNDFDPTSFDAYTQTQEDRSLTALYTDMRLEITQCFGEANTLEIENVFIKKSGPNIRNLAAHGLLSDSAAFGSDAVYANWMIFRLCCLPLLPHWGEIEKEFSFA